MSQVWVATLSERSIQENPFRCFAKLYYRAGIMEYTMIDVPRRRTDIARDWVCSEFKKESKDPDDVLVLCDCDHLHPEDLPERLVENDVPVVAALAFRSNKEKPTPCFWIRDQNGILRTPRTWELGLIRVAVAGTGAIAIKRSVFTQLDEAGYDKGLFKYQYHPNGDSSSEEVLFMQILESEGIPVYVDSRVVTPHWTDGQIDESNWNKWLENNPEPPKKEHRVSVIIPQKGRQAQLKKCLDSLFETAPNVECIVMVDQGDSESWNLVEPYTKTYKLHLHMDYEGITNPIEKWNHGAELATGDVLMLASNDLEFQPQWIENVLEALDSLPGGDGVVALADGHRNESNESFPHYIVSRSWIDKYYSGKLYCPLYHFYFGDTEIAEVARSTGHWTFARAALVKHAHPFYGDAKEDEIHRLPRQWFELDKQLYLSRKELGFPISW